MLADDRARHCEPPRKVAFILWSNETAQTGEANEAQILHLLGVVPIRDARGAVVGVALIETQAPNTTNRQRGAAAKAPARGMTFCRTSCRCKLDLRP